MAAAEQQKKQAATALANGQSQAQAAKAAGVNRSTVLRWFNDQSFVALIEEERERIASMPEGPDHSLESLVPDAHALLARALSGQSVPAGQARVALDVLKAAAALTPVGGNLTTSLEERLAHLDSLEVESD